MVPLYWNRPFCMEEPLCFFYFFVWVITIMTTALNVTHRLNYLDAARAFALLLGIVFHASLSFMPIYIGWAVMDVSTSQVASVFILISHSFRMALFFLIAGFFSHRLFHRDGINRFLQSRFIRLAIPFVAAWFILRPLLVSGWIMGAESMRGETDILNALLAGVTSLKTLPYGLFVGTHLWFLYVLMWVTLLLLAVRAVVGLKAGVYEYLKVRSAVHWVCRSRFAFIAVAIPTAGCLWFMAHWGMDTPDKSLIPHLPTWLIYGGFYTFGWVLHKESLCIEQFSQLTASKCVLCALSACAACVLSSFEAEPNHPYFSLIKVGFVFSYALMMWSLVSITLGVFKHFCSRPNRAIRYLADSSYWLYLIHLPIVIGLQIAFSELPLNWLTKLTAISVLTIILSLIMYEGFVRSTWLGALLNGKRKPRFWSR